MTYLSEELHCYIDSLVTKHNIPAVSIAVWHNNQLYKKVTGTLNVDTGVEATADSIFQIGSITKIFTSSLVMQLVERDLIDLDLPVKKYLRDFQIADARATEEITVRQLLDHTSGLAGDYFPDDVRTMGNPIARFVDRINLLPLAHQPGEMTSYSNTAFAVAGRLIEVVTQDSWQANIEDNIFSPLGLNKAASDAKETIRYRAAMGHLYNTGDGGLPSLQPKSYLCLGLAPAGTTVAMSASNLLKFGCAHMGIQVGALDERWLTEKSLNAMQRPTIQLPDTSDIFCYFRGLGWRILRHKTSGYMMVEHAGQICGQMAMLRLFPKDKSAIAVMINARQSYAFDLLVNKLTNNLVGINDFEPSVRSVDVSIDLLQRYVGIFESFASIATITFHPDRNCGQLTMTYEDKLYLTKSVCTLSYLRDHIFAVMGEHGERQQNLAFIQHQGRRYIDHLFFNGRLNLRV